MPRGHGAALGAVDWRRAAARLRRDLRRVVPRPRPTRDLVTDARQRLTRAWWAARRPAFDLVIAQPVLTEAAGGDAAAAARRLGYLAGLPQLAVTDEALALAAGLERLARLPARAAVDALHIALATVHGVDYLLTWNMRHIANAELRPAIEAACRRAGYEPPVIATPDMLMGE